MNETSTELFYYARNRITGEYWNGERFEGSLTYAVAIPAYALPVMRYTWMNVEFIPVP